MTTINPKPVNRFTALPVVWLIIALACGGVYFQTLNYGFTHHDDDTIITLNMQFIGDIGNIREAFLTDAWCRKKTIELYRPLQSVSYILDAQMGSDIAFSTHRTNLLIHFFSCMAVFHLLLLFGFNRNYSLTGALVYAVHYLFSHTVIWIPARGDLLLALFSFLSMIALIRLLQTRHWGYLAVNILTFALALFSKETAILLPVLFLFYGVLFNRKRIVSWQTGLLGVSYVIIYLIFAYLRNQSIATDEQSLGITALLLNLRTIPETVAKLFLPFNYSTMPFFNFWTTLTGIIIMGAMAVRIYFRPKQFGNLSLFALGWFLMFLLPGMIYRPEFASYTYEYLDHRAYLPSLGLLVIVLGMVREIHLPGRIALLLAVGILVYFAALNFWFHRCYENPLVFSEMAIKANPRSSLAHFIHGNQIYKQGDVDGALEDFSIALRHYPRFHEARYNRAVILHQRKQYEAALEDLNILLSEKPDYSAGAWDLRAIVKATLKDHDGAYNDFTEALKRDPDNPQIVKNFNVFQSSVTRVPDHVVRAEKLNNEGVEEAKQGRLKQALELFRQAVKLNPDNLRAIENIGNCLDAMGDREGACREWKKAAAQGSSYAKGMVDQHCK